MGEITERKSEMLLNVRGCWGESEEKPRFSFLENEKYRYRCVVWDWINEKKSGIDSNLGRGIGIESSRCLVKKKETVKKHRQPYYRVETDKRIREQTIIIYKLVD